MQEVNEATLSRSSETAKIAIAKLRTFIESQSFRGYDPYDALNSPLLRLISVGRKYPRIAMIQLMKRLPWNLRPLLLIPKGLNPKGLGLFLWGYAKLYEATGDPTCREICEQLIDLLKETQSDGWSGATAPTTPTGSTVEKLKNGPATSFWAPRSCCSLNSNRKFWMMVGSQFHCFLLDSV